MPEGLKRTPAAAEASRTAKCHVCLKPWKLRFGRLPQHGPPGNRCKGSNTYPQTQKEDPDA